MALCDRASAGMGAFPRVVFCGLFCNVFRAFRKVLCCPLKTCPRVRIYVFMYSRVPAYHQCISFQK